MAYAHPRVLCVGSYPAAFESRNRILELAGFEVVPSLRGAEALTKFAGGSFDCVVIGDSSEAVRLELMRDLRRINPSVPIVVVYPLAESSLDSGLADAAIDSLEGPEALLGALFSVIRKVPQFAVIRGARVLAAR